MKRLLCLLLLNSVAGFDFYVSRQNGVGLCASDERHYSSKEIFPIYDLEGKGVPPEDEKQWTDTWALQNFTIDTEMTTTLTKEYRTLVTDGSAHFKPAIANSVYFPHYALAANATLVLVASEKWVGREGVRLHLDHVDPDRPDDEDGKRSWAETCTHLDTPKQLCSPLKLEEDRSRGGEILYGGRRWQRLRLYFSENVLTVAANGEVIFIWDSTPSRWYLLRLYGNCLIEVPGVFRFPLETKVSPVDAFTSNAIDKLDQSTTKNQLSRIFRFHRDRAFCLEIHGQIWSGDFTVSDRSGREVHRGQLDQEKNNNRYRLSLDLGVEGDFLLELKDLSGWIYHVGHCTVGRKGANVDIFRHTTGCTIFEQDRKSIAPTSKTLSVAQRNASVQVDLSEEQLGKVCTALGFVRTKNKSEKIQFCSQWGCNSERCPPRHWKETSSPLKVADIDDQIGCKSSLSSPFVYLVIFLPTVSYFVMIKIL